MTSEGSPNNEILAEQKQVSKEDSRGIPSYCTCLERHHLSVIRSRPTAGGRCYKLIRRIRCFSDFTLGGAIKSRVYFGPLTGNRQEPPSLILQFRPIRLYNKSFLKYATRDETAWKILILSTGCFNENESPSIIVLGGKYHMGLLGQRSTPEKCHH